MHSKGYSQNYVSGTCSTLRGINNNIDLNWPQKYENVLHFALPFWILGLEVLLKECSCIFEIVYNILFGLSRSFDDVCVRLTKF